MQKLFSQCMPWLTGRGAAVLGVLLLGSVAYAEWSGWGVWLGATPLLGIALCVLPCLIPLAFLWRKDGDRASTQIK